ncbi:protein RGF1 INDUCIBLE TRANSCRIPTION FACTOR 1-like [Wolffia australiana]
MDAETSSLPWLGHLLAQRFFGLCERHKPVKKSELNIYCIDCNLSLCFHCLSSSSATTRRSHTRHRLLQIRRYVYQDVIKLDDMHKYVDCSNIQVVLLNPKRQTSPASPGSSSGLNCKCRRPVAAPYRYCSLSCKVLNIEASDEGKGEELDSTDMEDVSPGESSYGVFVKTNGASRRKGTPARAHFF